jgi:WD40-like Beta Propeller Repeat
MSTLAHRTSLAAVVALAAAHLLAGLVHGGSALAAYPGANGKIVYENDNGVEPEIFVMNADGSGQTNLTNDPGIPDPVNDRDPTWSPDGTKIAFSRANQGHMNVYVMNPDGSARIELTPGAASGNGDTGVDPSWSPSGTRIVYSDSGNLWTMDAASGTGKLQLTMGPAADFWPAWSPDGTKIAFVRDLNIYVMNADGSGLTPLAVNAAAERSPDWAPDGSKIVYERNGQIYSMNANGSAQTPLTGGAGQGGTLPAWSPDGTKIVFDSNAFTAPNGYDIFVMNPDGTGVTRLNTTVPTDQFNPSWQPVAVPGGHARPVGASPVRVSLVPAYKQCAAPNRLHGPPLEHPSCNPPAPESSQLTVGTSDANGQPPNSRGFAKYGAVVGAPGGADESDVRFTFQLTDVRRQGGTLPDYTGELEATTVARITDKLGGPANEAATVTDFEFPVTLPCAETSSTTVGATCSITTSFDTLRPGAIREGKRAIWQLEQVRVNDGGADGLVSTTPNTLFAVQGVFIP